MKKNLFKKSIALLMTVMMLMTCWVFVAPEKAEAAAGQYYFKFVVGNISEAGNSGNWAGNTLTIAYRKQDGTNGTVTKSLNKSNYSSTGTNKVVWEGYIDGFPTSAGWYMKMEWKAFASVYLNARECQFYVGSSASDCVAVSNKDSFKWQNDAIGTGNKDNTFTLNAEADKYPAVSKITCDASKEMTFETNGSNSTVSIAAKAVDQYNVEWLKTSSSHTVTLSPNFISSADVGSMSYDGSTITLKANHNALGNLGNKYDATTGIGTSTLTVACGTVSKDITITLKSKEYTVTFKDAKDTHTAKCYYGGTVTPPAKGCAKSADENFHYAFKEWGDKVYSNIKANKTVDAIYTSIGHNFSGAFHPNADFTHSLMCTGEGADEPCTYYGIKTEQGNITYGSILCKENATWGGTDTWHTGSCNDCGNDLGHTPQRVQVVDPKYRASEADCNSPATYYESCSVCGQAITSYTFTDGDKLGHDFVFKYKVEPTCTANGYDVYGCQRCQDESLDYSVEKDGEGNILYPAAHKWNTGRAKDMGNGYHSYQCTVEGCGVWDEARKEKHSYNQGGFAQRADCENDGVANFTCGGCGATTTSKYKFDTATKEFTTELVAPALGHNWVKVVDADHPEILPTCTTPGSYWERCTRGGCGAYEQREHAIDPDAHHYLDAVPNGDDTHTAECEYCHKQVTASCKDHDDNKDCVCDICNDPIAHEFKNIVSADKLVSAADCNSYAVYYKSCSVCGTASEETFEDVEAGYGAHDWDDTKKFIKSVAKCETDAVYYYECLECGMSSEDFDGSTWTDEGSGYAHVFNGIIVRNNDGTHSYTCSNVDAEGVACTEIGGTVGCTYGEWDKENANGHTHTCLDCGYTTPVEAHNWGEGWKPAEGNTGAAAGQMTRTCTVCSRIETTNCQYGEGVVFEANCMHDKYTEYTCSDCGHGYTVIEEGTKLDHSYTGNYEFDADSDMHRQLCVNGCNEYGNWYDCELEYTNTGVGTHHAECVCGNEFDDTCSGGAATCTNKAVCQYCKTAYGEYAPHNFSGVVVNVVDGTMNEDGTFAEGAHWYNCTTDGCGEYGVGTTAGATEKCYGGTAYCKEQALCEACGNPHSALDPDNHKTTKDKTGKAPTCMEDGYTDYKQCVDCNTEIDKEVIPADPDAHKWSETATSDSENKGKHYFTCEYNAEHKDVYDCFCEDPTIIPPTCTEWGYTLHTCDCGYQWKTDDTEPIGHEWGENGGWITDENKTGHYRVCLNDENHVETGICAESATAVVTAPTCTEQGFTTYTCDLCGNVWKDNYTDPTGHTYTQKIIDDAHLFTDADYEATGVTNNKCERADYYWFDCKDCDKNGKDETDTDKYPLESRYYQNGKGEGHTWDGRTVTEYAILATAATCDKNATYYVYCTACHMSRYVIDGENAETFEAFGTELSHDYQNLVNENDLTKNRVSEATCTAKAEYYKSCANCGDVSEDTFEYGEKTSHKYTKKISDFAHIITEANCTTVATYWYNCEYCNSNCKLIDKTDMTEDEIKALQYTDGTINPNNHGTLTKVPFKAPTCKEAGHSEYKVCSLCKKELGKITAGYEQKDHSFKGEYKIVNVVDSEGNVTAYKHQIACEYDCGTYTDVTDCGFSAWRQNADGKTHSMACACGNKITKDCVANSNASCETAATCKDCGGEMTGTASGHDWGNWTSNGDGKTHSRVCKTNSRHTETENCDGGVASGCGAIYCATCNQQYATGVDHDWGEWVTTSPATCTAPAERKRACQAQGCGATEEETFGTVLGHDYDKDNDGINDGVVTKEATCTDAGVKTFTCLNNCGETYTEVIKALGHELAKEWTVTLEPTCAAEGKKIKKCVHSWKDAEGKTVECDYYEESTIPANIDGHVEGEWIPDEGASNCATGLKSYKYCTVCGLQVDQKIETISHSWKSDVIVYGTCTANGYIKMVCDKCGSAKVFDENTPGFPNKLDETVIDGATASKLLSKGGHKWATTPSGNADYVIQNGAVIYVTTAATCSKLGSGYMVCTADGCKETKTVSINKTGHTLKTMPASAATCTTPGHTEYLACRNCPYAEEPTVIPKLGHVDTDGSGKCDRCGFQMYTPPSGGTAACGCMCHNSNVFIAKLIYPIARFFWKLFKTNKSCSCGKVHY